MSYKDEVESKLKRDRRGGPDGFTVTVGKDYAVVEGHRGILTFLPSHICVKLKKGKAEINGEDMTIASSQKEEIVIKGKISDISFDGVEKK